MLFRLVVYSTTFDFEFDQSAIHIGAMAKPGWRAPVMQYRLLID